MAILYAPVSERSSMGDSQRVSSHSRRAMGAASVGASEDTDSFLLVGPRSGA